MSIIIDRTNSANYQVDAFDSTFVGRIDLVPDDMTTPAADDSHAWLQRYLSDVTFSDTSKHLTWGFEGATTGSWVYVPNIDYFNALATNQDQGLVITPELLKTYEQNYWRILYYSINIDYNPLDYWWHGKQFMNVLLNLWDGLNATDGTTSPIGLGYMYWDQFCIGTPVDCILWTRPQATKSGGVLANYLRQSVEFVFMLSVSTGITVCGAP